MGGRPQKREKASGRKGWELGSTWNVKWIHVGIGVRWPRFTLVRWPRFTLVRWYGDSLPSFYVGVGLRCPRFPLASFYVGTRFTFEAGDWVTLRGC